MCGHNVDAVKRKDHVFAGFLKADIEKNPALVGGVCAKCKSKYTIANAPAITLCNIGDQAYNHRIQKVEESLRIRGMNQGFVDRVESNTGVLKPRKVA